MCYSTFFIQFLVSQVLARYSLEVDNQPAVRLTRWMGHITVWIITAHGATELAVMAMDQSAGGPS